MTTLKIILPILEATYGRGSMVTACAEHLAERIDAWPGTNPHPYLVKRGIDHMIFQELWNWFSGGDTAAAVTDAIISALGLKP